MSSNSDISQFVVSDLSSCPTSSIFLAIEQAGVGIAYWDLQKQIVYFSSSLDALCGCRESKPFLYEDFLAQIHPHDRLELYKLIEQVKRTSTPGQVEYRIMTLQEQQLRSCFNPCLIEGQLTHLIEIVFNLSNFQPKPKVDEVPDLISLRAAISTITSALVYRYPLAFIYTTVSEFLTCILQADCVHIYQYEVTQQIWRNIYDYRQRPDLPSAIGVEFANQNNCISNALRQAQPLQFNSQDFQGTDPEPEFIAQFFGLWMVLPIQINNHFWGSLLIIRCDTATLWTEQEFNQAIILGDYISLAIAAQS